MSAERDFAQRVVRGMLTASCRALEPAWTLCPTHGTWIKTETTAPERLTDFDRWSRTAPTGELLSALQSSSPQTNGEQAS